MGKIADHIRSFVPFTAHGECSCGCKGGILAQSTADSIITATCSDWGCYGLMAALAYLLRNIDILHTEEMEAEVMRAASRSGLIDMTGSLLPGIDGFNLKMNVSILSLMRQCTDYALRYSFPNRPARRLPRFGKRLPTRISAAWKKPSPLMLRCSSNMIRF